MAAAALVPGTFLIPGVGEVIITAALVVTVGPKIVEAGTEVFSAVSDGLKVLFSKQAKEAAKDIPSRLKKGDDTVDLDKFNKKKKGGDSREEDGGWEIDKDKSGHGGSKWKLKNKKGERVASLDGNGKILRK